MTKEIIKNTRVTDYTEINAPIDVVWKDLTHFDEYDWDPEIQKVEVLTPDIRGIGMKTQWKFVNLKNEEILQQELIVEWNPPNYYSYRPLNSPASLTVSFILKPIEKGTLAILTKCFDKDNDHIQQVEKVTSKQMQMLKKSSEAKAKK
ncbi:MAG: SRPBCC family protein [Candidatus Ranarchaeia archaeon]